MCINSYPSPFPSPSSFLISFSSFLLTLLLLYVELGIIKEKRVAQTMLKVDRANYVPVGWEHPYKEMAVPIGTSFPSFPFPLPFL